MGSYCSQLTGREKIIDEYNMARDTLIGNSDRLLNLQDYDFESIEIILKKLEQDLLMFKKELGFIARRDMVDLWSANRKIKYVLENRSEPAHGNAGILSNRKVQLLKVLGADIIEIVNKIDGKVRRQKQ